jgi:hypothetical protein
VDHRRWRADPEGRHELRFFTAAGRPTNLVMDGGVTAYDLNPDSGPQPTAKSSVVTEDALPPETTTEPVPSPVGAPSQTLAEPGAEEAVTASVVVRVSAPVAAPSNMSVASGDIPILPDVDPPPTRPTVVSPMEVAQSAAVVRSVGIDAPFGENSDADEPVSFQGMQGGMPFGRTVKLAYIGVFALLALSALGLLYVHVKPSGGHPAHAIGPTTTTSAPATTTTTALLPTALKPGAEDAATALVSNWAAGNRAAALTVATPAAVTALFATPYTSGLAIDRGCSTSFSPIVCTFGPPGGASPTDPIFEIDVTQAPGGWYVSSVSTEN